MKKIVIVDGHSILNRAFYGLPDLTNSEGVHTNAVLGFLNIVLKLLEEEQPTHFAVAFDVSQPTFRHEKYEAYKGTRKPMAEELRQQVPLIKEVLESMGVTILEKPSLSTASAPPAGTFVSSAQTITMLPIRRISSLRSPQALSRPLPLSEFEQTSSHRFSFVCAGEKEDGFIS